VSRGNQSGAEVVLKPIDVATFFGDKLDAKGCYYMEFKLTGSTEYSRSVFVAG
jgi:hypothetical protein